MVIERITGRILVEHVDVVVEPKITVLPAITCCLTHLRNEGVLCPLEVLSTDTLSRIAAPAAGPCRSGWCRGS